MAIRVQEAASVRLDEIYRYTRDRWGEAQAETYLTGLFVAFEKIETRGVMSRPVPAEFGVEGYFFRYERHFVYWKRLGNGDIESFAPDGRSRLIEVKTTNGWECTPFLITRNELAVAEERRSEWRLFRLWNFSREPKAFELHPPLDAHVALTATTFQASFH